MTPMFEADGSLNADEIESWDIDYMHELAYGPDRESEMGFSDGRLRLEYGQLWAKASQPNYSVNNWRAVTR